MRNEILQLKDLGRMPNESINDSDSIDELINAYDTLLEQIQLPISFDEAMVLVQIFPENAFYDLQWSLLRLVESVCVDNGRYLIRSSDEYTGIGRCSTGLFRYDGDLG